MPPSTTAEELSATLVFQHQSPDFHPTLHPVPYSQVSNSRENPDYMEDREQVEDTYREMLPHADPGNSFLYASIVGMNEMEDPSSYPGYTYFFTMSPEEIELCAYEVVDANDPMPPLPGTDGLIAAIAHWVSITPAPYFDDVVGGQIDPRIEVIVPFEVEPYDFVPQAEDR